MSNRTKLSCDATVVGAGVGGIAAALAIARNGRRVILTEETDWIGGQSTSQAVPPDEHGWIERFGCTRAYRRFRNGIRDYYRSNYALTAEAKETEALNPGNGWVSRLCHEPKVALALLNGMLEPYKATGSLEILLGHRIVATEMKSTTEIESVTLAADGAGLTTVQAKYFLDATELG